MVSLGDVLSSYDYTRTQVLQLCKGKVVGLGGVEPFLTEERYESKEERIRGRWESL